MNEEITMMAVRVSNGKSTKILALVSTILYSLKPIAPSAKGRPLLMTPFSVVIAEEEVEITRNCCHA